MASGDRIHGCPVADCNARVPRELLICPTHWQLVPAKLKRALRQARRGGQGAGTRAYRAAAQACIQAARSNSQPTCDQNLRAIVRRFLAAYRHPNKPDRESWDDEDTTRALLVLRCRAHKPDARTSRCLRCGATVTT